MRSRLILLPVLAALLAPGAGAQTPEPSTVAPPVSSEPVPPPTPAPVPPVAPPPRPVSERPKPPVERPKPVEKPRVVTEVPKPVEVAPPQPVETPVPPPAEPAPIVAATPTGGNGFAFGCAALAFAMLVIGFAAGFVARHFWSRRKLGGMTVRIGTWRGIP